MLFGMKDNIERLASKSGKLLMMTGAMHLPNMEKMLNRDGIAVVEVDMPETTIIYNSIYRIYPAYLSVMPCPVQLLQIRDHRRHKAFFNTQGSKRLAPSQRFA